MWYGIADLVEVSPVELAGVEYRDTVAPVANYRADVLSLAGKEITVWP